MKEQLSVKLDELKKIKSCFEDEKSSEVEKGVGNKKIISEIISFTLILLVLLFVFNGILGDIHTTILISVFITLVSSFIYYDLECEDSENNFEEETYLLSKEQIKYFYQPLVDYFGEKELADQISMDYEDDDPDDREVGDINLVIYLYEEAIRKINREDKKTNTLSKINAILNTENE